MIETSIKILIMLLASNGTPVIATYVFKSHGALPLDLGKCLQDHHPILGSSKTWRGLFSALVTSCILSLVFGYGLGFGLVFGSLAMAGDLISSFIKRRKGLESSAQSPGLDQLPESLLPSIYAVIFLGIEWWWAILLALAFMLIQIITSRLLFSLHIRRRPY